MNYIGHDRATLVTSVAFGTSAYYIGRSFEEVFFLVIGAIFGGMLLSPDLDIKSRIYQRWGIFRFFWLPYQKIVPHRSWVSHSGFSSLIRLLYLFFPIVIPLYIFRPDILAAVLITNYAIVVFFIIGVFLSDLVHVFFDQF